MTDPTVQRLCDEFELAIVHKYVRPVERETRAADTLKRVLAKRGKAREKAVSLRPWPVRGSLRVLLWIALEERLGRRYDGLL